MNGRELMHLRNRSGPVVRGVSRAAAKRISIEQELVMAGDEEEYIPVGDPLKDRLEDLDGPSEDELKEISDLYGDELLRDPDEVEVDLTVEDLYPADQDE